VFETVKTLVAQADAGERKSEEDLWLGVWRG